MSACFIPILLKQAEYFVGPRMKIPVAAKGIIEAMMKR